MQYIVRILTHLFFFLLLSFQHYQGAAADLQNTCRKQTGLEPGCSAPLDGVDPERAHGTHQVTHARLGEHEPLLNMLDKFASPETCSMLADPSANLTLFLPPASLLTRLEAAFNGGLVTLQELQYILSLHIIPQHLTERDLRSMDGHTLTTAGSGIVEVNRDPGPGDLTITAGGSTAHVFTTNIASCAPDTILHEIESVLSKHSDWRWYVVPAGDESEHAVERNEERKHVHLNYVLWAVLSIMLLTSCVGMGVLAGIRARRRQMHRGRPSVHIIDPPSKQLVVYLTPLPEVLFRRGPHLWSSVPKRKHSGDRSNTPSVIHNTAETDSNMEINMETSCEQERGAAVNTEELESCFSLNMRPPDIACVICFDNVGDHVFIPCGHGGYCAKCAQVVFDRDPKQCPICRQALRATMKVALDTAVGCSCVPIVVRGIDNSPGITSLRVSAESSGTDQTQNSVDIELSAP